MAMSAKHLHGLSKRESLYISSVKTEIKPPFSPFLFQNQSQIPFIDGLPLKMLFLVSQRCYICNSARRDKGRMAKLEARCNEAGCKRRQKRMHLDK